MRDEQKTKKQLIDELAEVRRRVAGLEQREAAPKKHGGGDRRIGAHITKHERTEQPLENEQRLRKVLEDLESVAVQAYKPDGTITFWNRASELLYGFSASEVLGRNLPDLLLGPETRDEERRIMDQAVRTGVLPPPGEIEVVQKDGTKRTILTSRILRQHPDGELEFYCFDVDITERKRAEEELGRERARAQNYLDIAGVMVVAIEPNQSIALVNRKACGVLGYDERDLIGRNWFDTVIPEDVRDAVRDVFSDLMAGRIAPREYVENQVLTKRGEKRLIAWHNTALRDEEGRIVATLSSGEDVTELRQAENELENLRQALAHVSRVSTMGELATALAHELNQPLAAIRTNAAAALQSMAAGNPDMKELREILGDIAADDERAGEIIRRMREPLKRGDIALKPLDMNALVRDIHQLVRNDAVLAGATIHLNLAPALPPVLGDRIQMQQVLMNLMVNALDAVKGVEGGQRRIEALTIAEGGNAVRVEVRDSGPGVRGDDLEKIFEFLYTTKQEGLGVGLAICRTIVDAYGGRIWAETPSDGGTRLVFTIPAYRGSTRLEDKP